MASCSGSLKRKYDVFSASGSGSLSALPTGRWKYDVFLSFRGEDTRYTFLDHLHTALVQRGIFVFKDDEELKTGKPISPELLKAIEESRYAVVVFSKNYANSSWCLAELAKIMECHKELGQKVIPVFYHVDPSDIRGQKKEVADFFQQHEVRFRQELDKVKEWREALTAAANLTGFHMSDEVKEGESSYIRKIVDGILADIQPSYTESNLVGIASHMDELNSLLQTEENGEVRIVGIHGMGGIGKTTIAKALFRRIAYKFEGSSFVNDVRENSSSKRDLCALQEKLLKEILMTNHNFNVRDPEDGAYMIKERFVQKKVLVVFDDVDDFKQLEFLSATHDSFGPGSRIIITTRNEHLLSNAYAKYKPNCLQMHEALELFSRHAFKRDNPQEGYEELSRRAIHYAGYLPLAVKVLGSFFCKRKPHVWESAFNRLAKAPNIEIFKTLKLSFDGLEASEKEIFLDIACFYKGKHVLDVTKVLESCGFDPQIGIDILIEKSLITISYNERIGMHDLIQEMGWQIAREAFPNSRLRQLEDIHDSLKNNQNLEKIEAIVLSVKQYDIEEYEEKVGFSANVFEQMKNLRLLDIRGRFTSSEPTFFPDNLRWLSWSQYPFSSLSMTHMSKLVGLKVVGGTIKQFWNGQKIMPNLKILKLKELDYLSTFPDVSGAPNIEELWVIDCKNLVEFHKSLGSHKRIFELGVFGCQRLKRLPSRFEMESLTSLLIMNCSSLERFPDMSPCMVKLSYIFLDTCSSIEGFLLSLGYLSSLEILYQGRYDSIWKIKTPCKEHPEKHGCKKNLVKDDTKALASLPKSICLQTLTNLCSLRALHFTCRPMESEVFLKNLQSFSSLEELDLSGNNNLIQLPATISHLSFLKYLKLNECHRLQILHGLPSCIEELEANNCYSLEKIDDLSEEYDRWDHISLFNCQKLLKDEDSKRYLEKMLRESFLKRCDVIDRDISFIIPGNKIPSWFKEEQPGSKIRLKIPPKCNNQIIGIAVCAVFPPVETLKDVDCSFPVYLDGVSDLVQDGENGNTNLVPDSEANLVHDSVLAGENGNTDSVPASHTDSVSDSVLVGEQGNTWILYGPSEHYENYRFGGILYIEVNQYVDGPKPVRCAAHLIYKEGVESTMDGNEPNVQRIVRDPFSRNTVCVRTFMFENDGS